VRLLFSATWAEGMDRKATRALGPSGRRFCTVRAAPPPQAALRLRAQDLDDANSSSSSSSSSSNDGGGATSSGGSGSYSVAAEALVVPPSVRQTVEVLVTSASSGRGAGRTRRLEALLHGLKVPKVTP
jgi:hypothetical protein